MSAFRFAPRGLVRTDSGFVARSHPVARYAHAPESERRHIVISRSAPSLRLDRGRIVRADPLR